jgi:Ca2+-binding EF-hand superfamily protein
MEGIIEHACRNLFTAVSTLEAAFDLLDSDKSGTIEYEELEKGLAKLDLGLSRSQLYELMSSIDTDKDGR